MASIDSEITGLVDDITKSGRSEKDFSGPDVASLATEEASRRGKTLEGVSVTFEGDDEHPIMRIRATKPPINVVISNKKNSTGDPVNDQVQIPNVGVRVLANGILQGEINEVLAKGLQEKLTPKGVALSKTGIRVRRNSLGVTATGSVRQ